MAALVWAHVEPAGAGHKTGVIVCPAVQDCTHSSAAGRPRIRGELLDIGLILKWHQIYGEFVEMWQLNGFQFWVWIICQCELLWTVKLQFYFEVKVLVWPEKICQMSLNQNYLWMFDNTGFIASILGWSIYWTLIILPWTLLIHLSNHMVSLSTSFAKMSKTAHDKLRKKLPCLLCCTYVFIILIIKALPRFPWLIRQLKANITGYFFTLWISLFSITKNALKNPVLIICFINDCPAEWPLHSGTGDCYKG